MREKNDGDGSLPLMFRPWLSILCVFKGSKVCKIPLPQCRWYHWETLAMTVIAGPWSAKKPLPGNQMQHETAWKSTVGAESCHECQLFTSAVGWNIPDRGIHYSQLITIVMHCPDWIPQIAFRMLMPPSGCWNETPSFGSVSYILTFARHLPVPLRQIIKSSSLRHVWSSLCFQSESLHRNRR